MGGPAAQARPPVGPVNDGGGKPPPYEQGNGRRVRDAAPYDSGPSPPFRDSYSHMAQPITMPGQGEQQAGHQQLQPISI